MRRKARIFILLLLGIIYFLARSVFTLVTLLFDNASADSISAGDLPPPNSVTNSTRLPLIPKIIHQTYKTETIPGVWKAAQQSCLDSHPDYEYILWTDEMASEFISTHYGWFLDTFERYEYPIQRADSIRYFVLSHFGGIYIDLDDGCNRRLDPLLDYPAWLRRTNPTGISNDAMGSVPGHPFFSEVVRSLPAYDRSWLFPYITIMYSTGPLFLSVLWKEYMRRRPNEGDRVHVLTPDVYMHHAWSFFTHHHGSSWHRDDAKLIFWLGTHWRAVTVIGIVVLAMAVVVFWMLYSRIVMLMARYSAYHLTAPSICNCSLPLKTYASYGQDAFRGIYSTFRPQRRPEDEECRLHSAYFGIDNRDD